MWIPPAYTDHASLSYQIKTERYSVDNSPTCQSLASYLTCATLIKPALVARIIIMMGDLHTCCTQTICESVTLLSQASPSPPGTPSEGRLIYLISTLGVAHLSLTCAPLRKWASCSPVDPSHLRGLPRGLRRTGSEVNVHTAHVNVFI